MAETVVAMKTSHIFRVRKGSNKQTVTMRRRIGLLQTFPILLSSLAWIIVTMYILGINLPFVDEILAPLRSSPEAGFILTTLAWIMGVSFYALIFLRQYGIRETIRINNKGIRLQRAFTIFSWSNFYAADKLADLRLASAEDREFGDAPQFEKATTALVFDHDLEMILCGDGLTDEQAKDILVEVKNQYPQYVK